MRSVIWRSITHAAEVLAVTAAAMLFADYQKNEPSIASRLQDFSNQAKEITLPKDSVEDFQQEKAYMLNDTTVYIGQEIINPAPDQAFLQKTLDLSSQFPMIASAMDVLEKEKVRVCSDKQVKKCAGYWSSYDHVIGIKNVSGEPGVDDVLVMNEEIIHAWDKLVHNMNLENDGDNLTPRSKVMSVLNLEASAKARVIAAAYEKGGEFWEEVQNESFLKHEAKEFQEAIDQGKTPVEATARVYYSMRTNIIGSFQKSYVHHALDWDGDDDYNPASNSILLLKQKKKEYGSLRDITHDDMLRSGHIPGSDVNFLQGFENLTAGQYQRLSKDNYKKLRVVEEAFGIEDEYTYRADFMGYVLNEEINQGANLSVSQYHQELTQMIDAAKHLPQAMEECQAVFNEYETAQENKAVSNELEERYFDAITKWETIREITTGERHLEMVQDYFKGFRLHGNIQIVLLDNGNFENNFDMSRINNPSSQMVHANPVAPNTKATL